MQEMRKLLMATLMVLATAGLVTLGPIATPVQAQQVEVSVSLFYDQLAPYGRWFEHPRWGWVWFPTAIDQTWRPYSRGQWVWTEEYGWYWESDESFGWAVYHYGRWSYDEYYGWIWIPSETWGPGWVAFRYSGTNVGWAPLAPDTLYQDYAFDPAYTEMDASYYWPRWVFVPIRFFMAPRVFAYAAAPSRNYIYIRQTRNVTNYVTVNRFIVNRSIEPRRVEAVIGRRLAPARINIVGEPRRVSARRTGEVSVYRPPVRIPRGVASPPPPAPARAQPGDRPRVPVQRNRTAPSERREATPVTPPARTTPPSTTTPPGTTTPPARVAPPTRTTPPSTTTPSQPPARVAPPTRTTPPRVTTPPSQPPARVAPPQPPSRTAPPPARTTPPAPGSQQPPCGGPGQPACPPR
jgi:hypothetical protein